MGSSLGFRKLSPDMDFARTHWPRLTPLEEARQRFLRSGHHTEEDIQREAELLAARRMRKALEVK